jgi:hypothetical protein
MAAEANTAAITPGWPAVAGLQAAVARERRPCRRDRRQGSTPARRPHTIGPWPTPPPS